MTDDHTTTTPRRLVTLREATAWLGLKDTRVTRRLTKEGRLKAVTIGNRVMITTKSLDELVDGDACGTEEETNE